MASQTMQDVSGRWHIDRVFSETGVDYRVFDRGKLAAEFVKRDDLDSFLKRAGVDPAKLVPVPGGFKPFPAP